MTACGGGAACGARCLADGGQTVGLCLRQGVGPQAGVVGAVATPCVLLHVGELTLDALLLLLHSLVVGAVVGNESVLQVDGLVDLALLMGHGADLVGIHGGGVFEL